MRASYADSFEILAQRIEISGNPRPEVNRPPRHDDEEMGPSIFRMAVEDVSLVNLTLTGLYVGRSEISAAAFRDSNLRLSAFNWSDIIDCDFGGADLSATDLRACEFRGCSFASAVLDGADLRGSSFESCDFVGASLNGARILETDRQELSLSAEQIEQILWSTTNEEPGGG